MFASGARLLRTRVVSSTTVTTAIAVAMLVLWLAGVVFTTLSHEYWRDEVRALSLARAATSPFDLYGLIQYDGHPVLWYLLLFIGTSLADSPLVLPIASAAVAMAAVALFVWRSPFELWVKGVFIFGALPFYEYSVVARNYGISMLLLFLAAGVPRAVDATGTTGCRACTAGEHQRACGAARRHRDRSLGLGGRT
jgi:hypothetical protein